MAIRLYNPSADEKRILSAANKDLDARTAYRRDLARLIHSPCFRRLQGKTQLFPSDEGDFFRNRLTHSVEVAQIATGLALNLNSHSKELRGENEPIDIDLVHFASLAHDLGHPPFGHDGERMLDGMMKKHGGFEGNAQTLRILTRLEKKVRPENSAVIKDGKDIRVGLNLTFRSIASILKYDRQIPLERDEKAKVVKGYYLDESELIKKIRKAIAPECAGGKFKTLECSIMDLADDIAYSTYDLEDAFKADFTSPLKMAGATDTLKEKIVQVVNDKMKEEYSPEISESEKLTLDDVNQIILSMFNPIFEPTKAVAEGISAKTFSNEELSFALSAVAHARSEILRENGYSRSELTSKLVYMFMSNVELQWNNDLPMLSRVSLNINMFKVVEVLKRFAFESLIMSSRLKMADRRGREIIEHIFNTLNDTGGDALLPDDIRSLYATSDEESWRMRTICDFIASMTDRYCVEFYSRLVGITVPSIYKPY